MSDFTPRLFDAIGKLLIALNERPSHLASEPFHEPTGQSLREMLLRTLHSERQVLDMSLALQRDRGASSSCLKTLAEDMVTQTTLNMHRVKMMLKAQEESARTLSRVQ